MKIQNPHDKFFKKTMGEVGVAKDFLHNYLPESIMKVINVNTLEPQKDSFINEELKEGFSDLLFKVDINQEEGYIYFLFEHKSYYSKNIALQLLNYMLEIWKTKLDKENKNALPIIIPLVIYHGKENWNKEPAFREMIRGYEALPKDLRRFIPDFEFLLYDLSKYTNEEIKGKAQLRIMLTVFRDRYNSVEELKASILKAAEYLLELEDRESGIEYFETLISYIFHSRDNFTKEDANEVIHKLETTYSEGSELLMTLAEVLRKEGREESKIEVIRNALNEGLEPKLISKLTGLSETEVKEIMVELKK